MVGFLIFVFIAALFAPKLTGYVALVLMLLIAWAIF